MASTSSNEQDLLSRQRIIQNFHLVWLDENINENNDYYRNSITQLRQVINTVNTFTNIDECMDFITDQPEEIAFMIVSDEFISKLIPIVGDIPQIKSIYILYQKNTFQVKWTNKCSKVGGNFTEVLPLCEVLQNAAKECDHNEISISFMKSTNEHTSTNKDTLDSSFMYTQILKDILLTIDFNDSHITGFLTYCRSVFAKNDRELRNIDKIQKEYHEHQPIWWYTRESFLYSMMNRALRFMDTDIIVKMGFFLRDVHNHIASLHAEQYSGHTSPSFTVYRGQSISQTDFDELKRSQGGLLAFNNFLSTSKSRQVSMRFVKRSPTTSDAVRVLFVLQIDPSIKATPFANVSEVSAIKREEEILFSMHSVFRIGNIKPTVDVAEVFEIELILTSDDDHELRKLTETIQEETEETLGWCRLTVLLTKLAKYDEAENLCETVLREALDKGGKPFLFSQLGAISCEKGHTTKALEYYMKVLDIQEKSFPINHLDIAASHNNIGMVYNKMGEYNKALEHYKKVLDIQQKSLPTNHVYIARSYHNIGSIYYNMGEYTKALEYYTKSLDIQEQILPTNHPEMAQSHNDIGIVCYSMDENIKALEYFIKSLDMREKSLPTNHPHIALSYNNIGLVYDNMGEYTKALEYYTKSLDIQQKILPTNHPEIAASHNNIGMAYSKIDEYTRALEYHMKSLDIREKILPTNHPQIAASHNNIGMVYSKMEEYTRALKYYMKALDIQQKSLPTNHPHIAATHNNIGLIYYIKEDFRKALQYFQSALNIFQRSLPNNHPYIKNLEQYVKVLKKAL